MLKNDIENRNENSKKKNKIYILSKYKRISDGLKKDQKKNFNSKE